MGNPMIEKFLNMMKQEDSKPLFSGGNTTTTRDDSVDSTDTVDNTDIASACDTTDTDAEEIDHHLNEEGNTRCCRTRGRQTCCQ